MPQSNNIALKVFSQAFNGKDIETVFNQLVSSISKETKKTEKEVIDQINNNLSFSKELQDKIISEFEKAEKSLGGKSFTFSKDLFKGIFDTNGIEEEINKVVKTFENNIESLINLKNRIGDDKVFFSMDTSQLDEAIKKEQQLIELIEKRNSLEKGDRSKTGITRNINNLEKELNSYISNLRSSSSNLSGQINVPTIDEKDLKLINKYSKDIDIVEKKLKNLNDAANEDDLTNAQNKDFIGYFQQYEKLMKESGQKINKEYQDFYNFLLEDSKLENFANHLKEISNLQEQITRGPIVDKAEINTSIESEEVETIKNKISELENQISEMQTKLQNLDGEAFVKMQNDIGNLESRLSEANAQIINMQNNSNEIKNNSFEELKNNVDTLGNKLDEVNKKLQEFVSLSSNVGNQTGTQINGDKLSGKVFHGTKFKWNSDKFDFSKNKSGQLGNGAYFTADAEKVLNFTKAEVKELEVNLDKCFILNKNYCSSIVDLYEAMGKEISEEMAKSISPEEAIGDVRRYNSSKENRDSFKEKMLSKGYQGMYVGDYLANKIIPEELIIYDEKKLENLKSFTKDEFKELKTAGNIEIKIDDSNIKELSNSVKDITQDVNVEGQNKLQSELKETEKGIQNVGAQAQTTKEKLEDLGKTDINKEVTNRNTTNPTPLEQTSQQDSSSILSEQQALEKLEQAINSVTIAIAQKNNAIQAEETQMDKSVNQEIAKLEELKGKLNEIKTQFENGIASGLFKNADSNDITIPGEVNLSPKLSETFKADANNLLDPVNVEKEVNLKPTLDADKFKKDAESILTFVDVEKEVALKVGELNTNNITGDSDSIVAPISENVENDNIIEEQNKDLEQQEFLYNNIIRLLTEYLSLQDKINSGNRRIVETYREGIRGWEGISAEDTSDIRLKKGTSTRATTKSSVKRELDNYLKLLNNDNVDTKQIDRAKEKLASYVYSYKDLEGAAEIFGKKNKEVFDEIVQMIESAKVSLDAYNESQMKIDIAERQLSELNKLQSGEKLTYGQLWDLEKVVKTDGLEAGLKYITDELGIKIPEAAKKAESAIAEVNNELNKSQQSQQPQMKSVEVETGNEQESNKSVVFPVPIEPLIDQTSWEKEIDRILELIGTKKIKIEPDTTSQEWNDFKTFINNISNKVINLKVKTDENNTNNNITNRRSSLPLDLNTSYKNSEKYIKEIWSLEEKIAQAKENNSKKDLKLVSGYESRKNKLEELLKLEEQFRASDNFNNIDTSQFDDYLNKLQETQKQIYETSRSQSKALLESSMPEIEAEAWKENEIFDNNQKLKEANTLLEQQKEKWQEIQDIRVSMESEAGIGKSENELKLLDNQKKALEAEKAIIDEQLKQYDSLIDKKKQSKELDKIESNANDVIIGTRVDDIDQAYKEANRLNSALLNTQKIMNNLNDGLGGKIFEAAFEDANNYIKNLNNQLISSDITLSQYNSKINELKRDLSSQKTALAFVDINDADDARNEIEKYINAVTKGTLENVKWNENTLKLTGTFINANNEIQKVTGSINRLSNGASTVNVELGNAQKQVSSFSKFIDELSVKFRNLATYLLSFVSFYEVWGAIRQGVTYVREFDTALTEMRKVSDETVESLKEFQEASFDIADSVGATAGVIQNSTAEWMRLGESLEQAAESAQVSNILLNVSEFESIDEATESLVAMSQAYNDVEKIDIVDKMNNIGNQYSIATDGIAQALQRSASSLTTAGNDLDEAIALVTAGEYIARNMWKHIFIEHI